MKKLLVFILLSSIILACEQEESVGPIPNHPSIIEPRLPGDILAWRLSLSLEDENFRSIVKEKLMEKFDGDYNFLLTMERDIQTNNGITLSEYLDDLNGEITLEELLDAERQLQIAMPELTSLSPEDWDTASEIPLVVYRSPDLDPASQSTLTGYRLGKAVSLSLSEEPNERILVVSHNERTLLVPKGKSIQSYLQSRGYGTSCGIATPFYQDDSFNFYLKDDLQSCGPLGTGTSNGNCDRDSRNAKDHVIGARFTTMNYMREAEHYLDGNPEVYFILTLASKNPSGFTSLRKSYPSKDRSQWKDCGVFSCVTEWHDRAQPVFNWDRETFGDLVRYDWFEEDFSSGKIEVTLGLTSKFEKLSVSGNVKITINKKDYFLDQDFVQYCDTADGKGSEYNTGKLLFRINHQ